VACGRTAFHEKPRDEVLRGSNPSEAATPRESFLRAYVVLVFRSIARGEAFYAVIETHQHAGKFGKISFLENFLPQIAEN